MTSRHRIGTRKRKTRKIRNNIDTDIDIVSMLCFVKNISDIMSDKMYDISISDYAPSNKLFQDESSFGIIEWSVIFIERR